MPSELPTIRTLLLMPAISSADLLSLPIGASRSGADDPLSLGIRLARCPPVWRVVLDLGVQFSTGENRNPGDIEPEQHDDDGADGAVGTFVVGEVCDVDLEEEGDHEPQKGRNDRARCDPHPVLIRV